MIETLFNASFVADSTPGAASHDESGVRLSSSTHRLKESNVDLELTVVDSVGFGDQVIVLVRIVVAVLLMLLFCVVIVATCLFLVNNGVIVIILRCPCDLFGR